MRFINQLYNARKEAKMIRLLALHFHYKKLQAQNGTLFQDNLIILNLQSLMKISVTNATLLSKIGENGREHTGFGMQIKTCKVY